MRILFSLDRFSAKNGGADAFASSMVQGLLALGHEIRICEQGPQPSEHTPQEGLTIYRYPLPQIPGIHDTHVNLLIRNRAWYAQLEPHLKHWAPHYVLTQGYLTPSSVDLSCRYRIHVTAFVHGYEGLSGDFFVNQEPLISDLKTDGCKTDGCKTNSLKTATSWQAARWPTKLKWPLVQKGLKLYQNAYRQASLLVANSLYMAEVLRLTVDRTPLVLYPVLGIHGPSTLRNPEDIQGQRHKPVLFVKPHPHKGLHLVEALVRSLPHRSFFLAGRLAKEHIKSLAYLSNQVTCLGWVPHMAEVYPRVSLILGPSQIPEPYGRVFTEAGLWGIPALASHTGGIPEAIGEGGILHHPKAPVSAWTASLDHILSEVAYVGYALKAQSRARELLSQHTVWRWWQAVEASSVN